jgi:hypothetical protein
MSWVVAALVAAAPASAKIVVNRSIGGVKLGESASALRAKMGAPSSRTCVSGSARCQAWKLTYKHRKLDVVLIHGAVASITTRSKTERTRKGVGPGVKFATAEQAYPAGTFDGGGAGPQWYQLRKTPRHKGDRYTFVDFNSTFTPENSSGGGGRTGGGTSTPNRVTDLTVGRYDPKYVCVLFSCAG